MQALFVLALRCSGITEFSKEPLSDTFFFLYYFMAVSRIQLQQIELWCLLLPKLNNSSLENLQNALADRATNKENSSHNKTQSTYL